MGSQHSSPPLTALGKMSGQTSVKLSLLFLLLSAVLLSVQPSAVPENKGQAAAWGYDDYMMPEKRNFDYDYYNPYALFMQKRGSICLPFGMSCSTKGIPCCNKNVECRCNLFSTNCKCQRASLFG